MTESSITKLQLSTGARIHFGLMEIHESAPNCYGGIGLMIEEPVIRFNVQIAPTLIDDVRIDSPADWTTRIRSVLNNWLARSGEWGRSPSAPTYKEDSLGKSFVPVRSLELLYGEPAHQGLGSGTQISSLVAHGLWLAQKFQSAVGDALQASTSSAEAKSPAEKLPKPFEPIDSQQLSNLSQRGLRSHIGLSGYLSGGLIVDPGRETGEIEQGQYRARPIEHHSFPDWPVVLIQNPEFTGEHGENEKEMFRTCAAAPNFNRERMLELIQDDLVPAVQSRNWSRWDRCIGEYGHLAGMIFRDVQSGVFRSQAIRQVVEKLHELGCQGACQSSWGPTVAVVAQDPDHAKFLADSINQTFPKLTTRITAARNSGVGVTS